MSSDGLYQYFTNEEAVSEVELFISWSPEGDPAQHLVEELLFRAAKRAGIYSLCLSEKLLVFLFRHLKKKKESYSSLCPNTGMDFHELLEIPQGDRRRYHDDVSIIVISLEGRIWKSCA